MKKWLFRIAVVVIGLPVLLALILGGLMVAGVDVLSFLPGEEWVTQWALAYLEDNFGLALEYEDVSLNFFSGTVAITKARLLDASNRDAGPLITADVINVGAVQQGDTYTVDRVNGEGVELSVPIGEGTPPLLSVLERLAPADVHSMVAETINDVPERYNGQSFTLVVGDLRFSQSGDSLGMEDVSLGWSGNSAPMLAIDKANVNPLMNTTQPKTVEVATITVTGHKVADDRYDLTDLMEMIERMGEGEASSETSDAPAQPMNISDIPDVKLVLMDGNTRAAEFGVGNVSVNMNDPQVTLADPYLNQAGNSVFKTNRIGMDFVSDWAFESLDAGSPTVTLTEREDGSFNLTDALGEVLVAFNVPMSGGASSSEPAAMPSVKLGPTNVTYNLPGSRTLTLSMDSMDLAGGNGDLAIDALNASVQGLAHASSMALPSMRGSYKPLSALTDWNSIALDGLTLTGYFDEEGIQPVETLTTLGALPAKLKTQLGLPVEDAPIMIDDLNLKGQAITITDRRMETPVDHIVDSISLSWKDIEIGPANAPVGDIALEVLIAQPSAGRFAYDGKMSPSTTPANAEGTLAITVESVQGYESYYTGQLPLELVSSGLEVGGDVKIDNDQLVSVVDVTLVQPEFAPREGGGAFASLNQTVAMTAINGIKDNDGNIVINGNRVEGDLNNPEFKPGISLFDVLGKNILRFILDTPGLITDPLGTGQALLEGTAGAVGGILGGGAEGAGNLLQGLLGGQSRSATETTDGATEEAEAANPAEDVGNAIRSLFGGNRDN